MVKRTIVWICLSCLFVNTLTGCRFTEFYPTDGEWYCEELQMRLSFDGSSPCYYLYKGKTILCACGADKGSSWLSVGCQEMDCEYFDLGEEVFSAEFVSLTENELIVYAESAEKEYVFYRVE